MEDSLSASTSSFPAAQVGREQTAKGVVTPSSLAALLIRPHGLIRAGLGHCPGWLRGAAARAVPHPHQDRAGPA